MFWITKAAENGHITAQSQLGNMYFTGLGGRQDLNQAEFWFRKSAEQGDASAQCGLGSCYHAKGNFADARRWYGKAAAQGHEGAIQMLNKI